MRLTQLTLGAILLAIGLVSAWGLCRALAYEAKGAWVWALLFTFSVMFLGGIQ